MKRTGCTGWSLAIILTVIFIALQVSNIINWTWLWLISPLWIIMLLDIIFVILIIFLYFYLKKH